MLPLAHASRQPLFRIPPLFEGQRHLANRTSGSGNRGCMSVAEPALDGIGLLLQHKAMARRRQKTELE